MIVRQIKIARDPVDSNTRRVSAIHHGISSILLTKVETSDDRHWYWCLRVLHDNIHRSVVIVDVDRGRGTIAPILYTVDRREEEAIDNIRDGKQTDSITQCVYKQQPRRNSFTFCNKYNKI